MAGRVVVRVGQLVDQDSYAIEQRRRRKRARSRLGEVADIQPKLKPSHAPGRPLASHFEERRHERSVMHKREGAQEPAKPGLLDYLDAARPFADREVPRVHDDDHTSGRDVHAESPREDLADASGFLPALVNVLPLARINLTGERKPRVVRTSRAHYRCAARHVLIRSRASPQRTAITTVAATRSARRAVDPARERLNWSSSGGRRIGGLVWTHLGQFFCGQGKIVSIYCVVNRHNVMAVWRTI